MNKVTLKFISLYLLYIILCELDLKSKTRTLVIEFTGTFENWQAVHIEYCSNTIENGTYMQHNIAMDYCCIIILIIQVFAIEYIEDTSSELII